MCMYKYRRIIISLIAGLLVLSLCIGLIAMVATAAKSDDIQDEINELESEADGLEDERESLQTEIESTGDKMMDTANHKIQVDKEIQLLNEEIGNVNEQIHQYNLLIAEKQSDLDRIQEQQESLLSDYKGRMRAIQEHGEISYWSILLNADSFADMLTYRVMIEEIEKADEAMMSELRDKAVEVLEAKEGLDNERGKLEDKMQELAEDQKTLDEKRQESDDLLTDLYAMSADLMDQDQEYETMVAQLHEEIAQKEVEYKEAKQEEWEQLLAEIKAKEEEERRRQEEERKRQEEEKRNQQEEWEKNHPTHNDDNNNNDNNDDNNNENTEENNETEENTENETQPAVSFQYPLANYGVITCPYGYRTHPITGNYSFHNGVDIGVNQGTPIVATRSGEVTAAEYNYAYGFMVTINHMDGYSSLYGHMTNFVVSAGQYVEQGQVIGYVGSTGISTGPHLHFTIYYNGSTVNPMEYIG